VRALVRALVVLSPLTAVTIGAALIQAKLLAVMIGPAGTGLYALAVSFMALVATLMGLGLNVSLPKLVAEFRESAVEDVWRVLLLGLGTSLFVGLTISAVLLATRSTLVPLLLGNDALPHREFSFVLVAGLIGALLSALTGALQGYLKGLRNIRAYVRATSLFVLLMLGAVVAGAAAAGPRGAIAGFVIGQMAGLIVIGLADLHETRKQLVPMAGVHRRGNLLGLQVRVWHLGFGAVAALLAVSFGQNLVRSYVTQSISVTAVGLFVAAWALSNRLPSLVYQTLSTHTVPTISALRRDWDGIAKEQNNALRAGLLVGTPALCMALPLLHWLIPIFLSSRFLPAIHLMRLMLVGELLSIVYWSTSLALYPTGRPTSNAASEWAWWGVFIALAVSFVPSLGLTGLGYAYILAYLLLCCAVYALESWHHGFRWTASNLRLILASTTAIATLAAIGEVASVAASFQVLAAVVILGGWATASITVRERKEARLHLIHLKTHVRGLRTRS
jgi:antigen flippase